MGVQPRSGILVQLPCFRCFGQSAAATSMALNQLFDFCLAMLHLLTVRNFRFFRPIMVAIFAGRINCLLRLLRNFLELLPCFQGVRLKAGVVFRLTVSPCG